MAAQTADVKTGSAITTATVRRVLPIEQAIGPTVEVVRGRPVITPAVVPRPLRRTP